MLKSRLAKLPNYIRRFGVYDGLRLMLALERELPYRSDGVRRYRVPGIPHQILLRECRGDHAVFWQCQVKNQYDTDCFPQGQRLDLVYKKILRDGRKPVIIDCGANIGLATVWYANKYPQATIYAIEPDRRNYQILLENTKHYGTRVVCLNDGVWNRSCHLRIVNPKSAPTTFRVEEVEQATEGDMRAYTIPEILELAGPESVPLLVKIDIEGAQKQLFSSNTDWVARTHLIAIELDDWLMPWQGTSRRLFACLSRLPFDYLLQGETLFCFQDLGTLQSALVAHA